MTARRLPALPALDTLKRHPHYPGGLLALACLVVAALLGGLDAVTAPRIAAEQARDLDRSLAAVLPPAASAAGRAAPVTLTHPDGTPLRAWRAVDGAGLAVEVAGLGYAGPIRLLVGLDPAGAIHGVRVLAHTETPGLGDRIEAAKSDWLAQFRGRTLDDPPADRWAVAKDGGTFDALSGATITPRAVVGALRRGLEAVAATPLPSPIAETAE